MESERPRLLVLASTFPRWQDDTEPRFVERLSYELAEVFDVVVLAPHCRGSKRREAFSDDGRTLEVRRFRYGPAMLETLAYEGGMLSRMRANPLRLLLLPVFVCAQALVAARLHRQFRFDAVHAHWIVPQGFVAMVLKSLWRRFPPVLVTSHGSDLLALRGALLDGLKRWVLGRADSATVVSNAMRDYCEERRIGSGKTAVQPMGVDLGSVFTPGESPGPREGLVYVGRLVEEKGVATLLEAMALLAADYPGLELTIVGDGPLREHLTGLADSRGVGARVHFAGSVPNERVPDHLRAAAIFVLPSLREGLGLVVPEAQGCGCAVVASDLPAVRDTVVDGETGLVAKPGDAADLAEKIRTLLDDGSLRESLAREGRRQALEKFDWPKVGANYARIIGDMVAAAR